MKFITLFLILLVALNFSPALERRIPSSEESYSRKPDFHFDKDTCIIEGLAFKMAYGKSKRIMRAYIKNSQLYVINDGLQFAKYRIIQYVFSSLTDEQMPTYRAFNQRLSPPVLKILKNARPGEQYIFEEIVIVDQQNNILSNEVRPLMIERIKN